MCENSAMAKRRGIGGYPIGWSELIASAQTVMSFAQEFELTDVSEVYSDEMTAAPLVAAARILDTASQMQEDFPIDHRQNQALCAAVAYSMYGNFPSADACFDRFKLLAGGIRSVSPSLLATTSPKRIPEILAAWLDEICPHDRAYLEKLDFYLTSGDQSVLEDLRKLLINCIINAPSAFDGALLRSSRLALEHIAILNVATVLKHHEDHLPAGYIHKLNRAGIRLFLPPQYSAISSRELLNAKRNVVLTLPTSTGKTLLAELFLAYSIGSGNGLVCFVAPYVAVVRQVAEALRKHLPKMCRVHRMIGAFKEAESLLPTNFPEVVVSTPERFDAMLRMRPELTDYLKAVVIDEAHLIQSGVRGTRLEGLITRLKLVQRKNKQLRLMLLSGAASNGQQFSDWLDSSSTQLISSQWKPTARRTAIWNQRGLTWYVGRDPVRRTGQTAVTAYGSVNLPWPDGKFHPVKHYGQKRSQLPLYHKNVSYLAQVLREKFDGSILAICSSRANARSLAHAVAERSSASADKTGSLDKLIRLINFKYSHLRLLSEILQRRVAYHVATLPRDVKELIEDCVRSQELFFVASTSTLAEGVDLPFRLTFIADWFTWSGAEDKPISTTLYRNIAGRCGRAGVQTEGDTIIIDNPLGPRPFDDSFVREDLFLTNYISDAPDELTSSLDSKENALEQDVLASLAAQFLAAIPENPDTDDLASEFLQNTFFQQRNTQHSNVRKELSNIVRLVADSQAEPFAIASSPLKLTELGRAANSSGFSPESCRRILKFLRSSPIPSEVCSAVSILMTEFADLPEQSNNDLKKAVKRASNNRFCVKKEDFEDVVRKWTDGMPTERIFAELPYAKRSKRPVTIDAWCAGLEQTSSSWDDEFDGFLDLISGVFQSYLPWLMRACDHLGKLAPSVEITPWRDWADFMEFGVKSQWAVQAFKLAIPADRALVRILAQHWSQEFADPYNKLQINILGVDKVLVSQFFDNLIEQGKIDVLSLENVKRWHLDLLSDNL